MICSSKIGVEITIEKMNDYNTQEIFEKGQVSQYTADLRTLFEIQNQKDCYYMFIPHIMKKMC